MKLTQAERTENREAFRDMGIPEKLDYIFTYYKFPLVLALISAVALGSVAYNRLTHKDARLYAAYANISVGSVLDNALNQGFIESLGLNPRRNEVYAYPGLYLTQDASTENHEYAYASQLKLLAAISGEKLDVMLMNREAYDLMSSGGYLMPLDGLAADRPELSARLAEHLTENTVILEDNDIEHRLDESVPYRAVTENAVNAIEVTGFPLFESAGFSGEVFLGVLGNTPRMDTVVRYIDYLTSSATIEP